MSKFIQIDDCCVRGILGLHVEKERVSCLNYVDIPDNKKSEWIDVIERYWDIVSEIESNKLSYEYHENER